MAESRYDGYGPQFSPPPEDYRPDPDLLTRTWGPLPGIRGFFAVVNYQVVGMRFIVTGFIFLLLGGIQALVMRTQLAQPNLDLVSSELYQQLFTMHGVTMMFFFAVPIFEGLAMYLLPLMIGSRDMAMPRLGAFGYWIYLIAGITLYTGFFLGLGPDAGWFAHAPLSSDRNFTPAMGMDLWVSAIGMLEISALVAAIEIVVTIFKLKAPGMSMARIPIFVWAMLVMAMMIIFAMPAVLLVTVAVGLDRMAGTHFFNAAMGGDPTLYQHVFWFFGHPEVYIIFTPALGVVSAVLVTFARRPMVAYSIVALSFIAMGILSFGVWVHHFFAVGIPPIGLSFFAVASMMVSIPSGIQMFAFIGTVWTGRPIVNTPFLFLIGFVVIFVLGGVTGVMLAAVPFNWQVHDSYFVVAHLHYVLIGGALFPLFAGLYYWFPKWTGKLLDETLGKWQFAIMFVGFNVTFFIQHILGFQGMARRVYTYDADLGWGTFNMVSTVGSFVLAAGILVFVFNVFWSLWRGRDAGQDPWLAPTLEWSVPSPPPQYTFLEPPVVRSLYPLWDPGAPDPEFDTAADRGERMRPQIRQDVRETFGTSIMDGEPESRVNLRDNSLWPFFAALAVGFAFVGSMFSLWFFPIGALLFYGTMIGWHWPFSKEIAT
ncbi:MAG: cytochrome c oxidase subunit 4 [Trueperaceae bacterium]|nr:cytochrome c oxidase subunit 4 [Trueperaceae bacterium]